MAELMDALGVALCYVLAAGVILGCVAFVIAAHMDMRKAQKESFISCKAKEEC